MRLTPVLISALAVASTPVAASWWSSDSGGKSDYTNWDTKQLQSWLDEHNIKAPSGTSQQELQELVAANWYSARAWSYDQYEKAQKVFADGKESAFDTWDDSQLRQFLLEQGVVAPTGPREKLVLAAKNYYNGYSNAASSYASTASSKVSTAIYGKPSDQAYHSGESLYNKATASASSAAVEATETFNRAFDDSKDYVYSTWDDNQLRSYLEEKGVIKSKQQVTRDKMLEHMRDTYAKVTNPVYEAYSNSYLVCFHHFLDDVSSYSH